LASQRRPKPQWVLDLEAMHGRPFADIEGTVYVLHFDEPRVLRSVSGEYPHELDSVGGFRSYPVRHYVGWTQQTDPNRRIARHGPGCVDAVVALHSGTPRNESDLKRTGRCPQCGFGLDPTKGTGR
jgi:hypothetical protein